MKKMIRLVGKDIKTADISIDHVQEYRGKLSMIRRDRDDINKIQGKILEMKSIISSVKNTLVEFTAE